VYSAPELVPQNISTGRPSQPQRPPGSKQCGVLLGITYSLNLSPRNPQRSPAGHSASPLQAKEGPFSAAVVATESVCGRALPQATRQIVSVSSDSLSMMNIPSRSPRSAPGLSRYAISNRVAAVADPKRPVANVCFQRDSLGICSRPPGTIVLPYRYNEGKVLRH
jgi:hypothetical protein